MVVCYKNGAEQLVIYGVYDMQQGAGQQQIVQNALIALGSNATSVWGNPEATILKARLLLGKRLKSGVISSRAYMTPAFPAGAGPDFANSVIRVQTTLSASEILPILHEIEAEAGRERVVRWGQRTLDLDLIAVDDQVAPDLEVFGYWLNLASDRQLVEAPTQLILPHPRLQDRAFVLVPMAEVAPDWVHPVLGKTVVQMRDARPQAEIASVRPI